MNAYLLRITPDLSPEVWLTVEFRGDQTLDHVHQVVHQILGHEDGHLYAFFLSGLRWDEASQYSGPGADGPRRADRTRLDRLALRPGKRFLYLFDFGDELRHEVRVVAVGKAEEGAEYPRFLSEQCAWPPRRHECVEEHNGIATRELEELGDEVTRILGGGGARRRADERSAEALRAEHDLAMKIRSWVGEIPERLDALEDHVELTLTDWVLELAFDLARGGMVEEAAGLAAAFAQVAIPEEFLGDRAIILAEAGRHDEARKQVGMNLARFPENPWVLLQAGEALMACGDPAAAEEIYRKILDGAWDDASARHEAHRRLVELLELLERQDRRQEAAGLTFAPPAADPEDDEESESPEEEPSIELDEEEIFAEPPPIREKAKVGRNDPCPCGSGRKHKKCCGAPAAEARAPKSEAELIPALSADLLAFARRPGRREEVNAGLIRYWGEEYGGLSLEEATPLMQPEWAVAAFFEWLIYDLRGPDGRTLLQRFIEGRRAWLDDQQRAWLEKAGRTHLGLYQVLETGIEERTVLLDLLRGGTIEIRESAARRDLVQWDVIAARLMEIDGIHRLTRGLLPFWACDKARLVGEAERAFEELRRERPGVSWPELLKVRGEIFNRFMIERLDGAPQGLPAGEAEELEFARAHYRVVDHPAALAALRRLPEIQEETLRGRFRWRGQGAAGGERTLGWIAAGMGRIVLLCPSRRLLKQGREILDAALGPSSVHLRETCVEPWLTRDWREREPPSAWIDPGEDQDGPILKELSDAWFRDWLDEPQRGMGGRSPRQLAMAGDGRDQAADRLREIQNHVARCGGGPVAVGGPYDVAWLWKELRLDPLAGFPGRRSP